jgi:hypothetical protein
MASIVSNSVELSQTWGARFCDYTIDSKRVDFQDLMVAISEKRAVAVEGEVAPLTDRIKIRNKELEALGTTLSELTSAQATLPNDATGSTHSSFTFSDTARNTIAKLPNHRWALDNNEQKQYLEYFIQLVKSRIDALNNESQTDMSRLQSLVDRRDESYSTATNLMSAVSDTRSNLIRNL